MKIFVKYDYNNLEIKYIALLYEKSAYVCVQ